MSKKVLKLIFIGHLLITVPVVLMYFVMLKLWSEVNTYNLCLTFILTWSYWSLVVPHWKLNSLKKIISEQEYFLFMSWSVNTGLIWPENFILTKTEFWNEEKFLEWKNIKSKLLQK